MELKLLLPKVKLNSIMFKSHLYGIEISDLYGPYVPKFKFKSHLYGIEIAEVLHYIAWRAV